MAKLKKIILSAGHGGIIAGVYQTKGKRSPIWKDKTQYFEGVGNRQILKELTKLLKAAEIPYEIVNDTNRDMELRTKVGLVNTIAARYGAKHCLFIDIHSDAWKTPTAHGYSVYTSPGETMSDGYAEELLNQMERQFPYRRMRTDPRDGDKDKEANFYVLRKTICPAILSENFFMTNPHECKQILMKPEGRRKIALAHFNMIQKFWNTPTK